MLTNLGVKYLDIKLNDQKPQQHVHSSTLNLPTQSFSQPTKQHISPKCRQSLSSVQKLSLSFGHSAGVGKVGHTPVPEDRSRLIETGD